MPNKGMCSKSIFTGYNPKKKKTLKNGKGGGVMIKIGLGESKRPSKKVRDLMKKYDDYKKTSEGKKNKTNAYS